MTQPQSPIVKAFFDEDSNTVSYVVRDPTSKACAIVDTVLDYDPAAGRTGTASAEQIIAYVRQRDLEVTWMLETHVHADHLSAAPYIQEQLGGKLAIGSKITQVQDTFGKMFNAGTEFARDGRQFDHLFTDGESFRLGSLECIALHTPGHTPACMTYVIGDAAFVGDTLFMPDYGTARCDFPGGDARTLYHSVQKLYQLPDETRLFLCHDYGTPDRDTFVWETTVGEEKQHNVQLNGTTSEEDFVRFRNERDSQLGMPRLILPSVQVNMRAGHLPPAEDNGVQYIKIPLNLI